MVVVKNFYMSVGERNLPKIDATANLFLKLLDQTFKNYQVNSKRSNEWPLIASSRKEISRCIAPDVFCFVFI